MNDNLIRLQQMSSVLNHERNLLNDQINEFEKVLNDLNLGIRCVISITRDPSMPRKFGYWKVKDKWGLYCSEQDMEWQVVRAPGYLRVECVKYFDELLEHMLKACKKYMDKVIEASENAKQFNERLKESK